MTKLSKIIRPNELNEMTIIFDPSTFSLEYKFKATGKSKITISSELTKKDFYKEVEKYSEPIGYIRTTMQNLF